MPPAPRSLLLCAALLVACSPTRLPLPDPSASDGTFQPGTRPRKSDLASAAALAAFEGPPDPVYRLGPGDRLRIDVWGRPELSGNRVVGPDGNVTLPVVGSVRVVDRSSDEAGALLTRAVGRAYTDAIATVAIEEYTANRVMVLGRVSKPGVLQFETVPTLLDAITRAGSLPVGGIGADRAALTRCAVFRGRDQVVWVDLRSILTGEQLSANIRLRRDDVVYVPDAGDQLVYVMGYVGKPGAYILTPDMSLLDALALAGGPTPDAEPTRMQLVRPGTGHADTVDFAGFLAGSATQNYALEGGDILYVPANWMADVGYVLQKLSPATQLAMFSASVAP